MKDITIIGSGVSGTLLVINLLKNHKPTDGDILINMIEMDPKKFNKGVAYSTKEETHLLNVRASGMSIFSDDPDNFINWLQNRGYQYQKTDFVPRYIFGKYVEWYFNFYTDRMSKGITIRIIKDEATDIHKIVDIYSIEFKKTERIITKNLILAIGHVSVSEVSIFEELNTPKYQRTPWDDLFLDKIGKEEDIFLIGSGLTSADIIASLEKRGHVGKIYSISRKGYLPIKHEISSQYKDFYEELRGKDINDIFSIVKKHIREAEDPRPVIDSMRPHLQNIWRSLTLKDKSRFIRHVNNHWNVIRHRMPPETHEKLLEMRRSDQLNFIKGKIIDVQEIGETNKISVYYYDKEDKEGKVCTVDRIINCIGPESNYKRLKMDLVKNLLRSGLIKDSEIGISIEIEDWNVVDAKGEKIKNLFAIGPLLKGELFESTAVPEIKIQAEILANKIISL